MYSETSLIELISQLGRKVFKRLMPLLEPYGLSTHEVLVLWRVRKFGVCRASDISDGTALAPSTLTGVIDRLESRDLVRRLADPNDRRSTNVGMTNKGEDLVRELLSKADAEATKLFMGFGEERLARLRAELVAFNEELDTLEDRV